MADECGFVYQVCSADYYFQRPEGHYNFKAHELPEAHNYSQQKARSSILQKTSLVIIDNTNICVCYYGLIFCSFYLFTTDFLRTGKCSLI